VTYAGLGDGLEIHVVEKFNTTLDTKKRQENFVENVKTRFYGNIFKNPISVDYNSVNTTAQQSL